MFSGTQQKCKVCTKTVYPMDQLSTDGVVFHRSCFKCQHCKSTLSVCPLLLPDRAHICFFFFLSLPTCSFVLEVKKKKQKREKDVFMAGGKVKMDL